MIIIKLMHLQTRTPPILLGFQVIPSLGIFLFNTLNRKQFANEGTNLHFKMRFIDGGESTIPGSTSILIDTVNKEHHWFNFEADLQRYFLKNKFMNLGFT